jgi:hypothetical protein
VLRLGEHGLKHLRDKLLLGSWQLRDGFDVHHLGIGPRLRDEFSGSPNSSSNETDSACATLGSVDTGMRLRPVS